MDDLLRDAGEQVAARTPASRSGDDCLPRIGGDLRHLEAEREITPAAG